MAGAAANPPSPDCWLQAKPLIERLYVQEDRPLKEVKAYMSQHRSFQATERMFKQRLKEWGFDRKKIKTAEWRHMLRVTRQRRYQRKESAFRVNGKTIVWSHIRKHLNRKKKSEDEFLEDGLEVETVEDVLCYTPPGSPRLPITQAPSPPDTMRLPPRTELPYPAHRAGSSSKSSSSLDPDSYGLPKAKSSSSRHSTTAPHPRNAEMSFLRASSAEGGALSMLDVQNNLLLPLSCKALPPLDRAIGLRISLMMSGSDCQSLLPTPAEQLRLQLSESSMSDRITTPTPRLQPSTLAPHNNAVLCLHDGKELSDDDLASRWVVSYFLACICESGGDQKGMEEGMEQASKVFRSMLKLFNPHLLTGLTLMASMLYFHGRMELLKRFLQQSCDIIEDLFSKDHPIFVPYHYMLSCVRCDEMDRTTMSEDLQRAWQQFQLTWRSVHPNTLTTRYYYGCSLHDAGNLAKAEEELRACFDLSNRSIGDCHILTVWSLATLSRVLSSSGKGKELDAIQCLENAIERCRKVMHVEHPYFLELHRYLAELHKKLNNLDKAEDLYRLVLKGRVKVLGLGQENTKAAVFDLSDILIDQDKIQEANDLRAQYQDLQVP